MRGGGTAREGPQKDRQARAQHVRVTETVYDSECNSMREREGLSMREEDGRGSKKGGIWTEGVLGRKEMGGSLRGKVREQQDEMRLKDREGCWRAVARHGMASK